jgi:hypothetical protein
MTDRELLELAAKAIGTVYVDGASWDEGAGWNPLYDDGDALRLAVNLDICVEPFSPEKSTIAYLDALVHKVDEACQSPREWHGTDPCAATRRAIVRAAAEIGRSKT